MTLFQPSPEQSQFFNALLTTQDNLLLVATAGSGKTTTIVEAVKRLPQPCRAVFLAFNRSIANELQTRMPYYAIADSFHAYCNQAIKRVLGRLDKPDGRKCAKLLKELVPNWKDRKDWEDDFLTLCSRAKSFGYGAWSGAPPLDEIRDRFGLEVSRLDLVEEVLAKSLALCTLLDFDDMLLHALAYDIPFDPCTHLFVDEGQDTNVVQALLLERMTGLNLKVTLLGEGSGRTNTLVENKTKARLIIVGDPNQAIYGFRGADADALDALRNRFSMKGFPLSVTYRCSKAVVEEARKWEGEGSGAILASNYPGEDELNDNELEDF